MFFGEMMLEIERRIQQACDDRARAGLPPPVSIDAMRAMVRADLTNEIEAKRVAARATVTKPAPVAIAPAPAIPPKPTPRPANPERKLSASEMIDKLTAGMDLRDPVFPSLLNPPPKPAPVVDQAELAARAILDARQKARGR